MSEQDRYIPGVPCWIDTAQPDPEAATAFYGGLFGWEFENVMPPESPGRYYLARLSDGSRGRGRLAARGRAADRGLGHVRAGAGRRRDGREGARRRRHGGAGGARRRPRSGARRSSPTPPAPRSASGRPASHQGATVVNEHGALNFNDLHTRDVEGAKAFYGAVFGWELLGDGDGSMWALPGYGDFLEQRRPGMREQMAAMGAPERFEDVVASLVRIGDDQPRHRAALGRDVRRRRRRRDRAAGGRARRPRPGRRRSTRPWIRATVISDPQGAIFTATKFVPENKDLASSAGAATSA